MSAYSPFLPPKPVSQPQVVIYTLALLVVQEIGLVNALHCLGKQVYGRQYEG